MPIKVKGNGVSQHSLTSFPAVISDNTKSNVPSYSILGNGNQNGTPTPDNPIQPEFVGVKTKNVMPSGEKKTIVSNGVTFESDGIGHYHISGTASSNSSAIFNLVTGFTTPISISNGGRGTLSFFNSQPNGRVALTFYNGTTKVDDWVMTPENRTHTAYNVIGNKYIDAISITVFAEETVDMMIMPEFTNDGVLPTEFEPYSYKIPITCAGQTTLVYLGEVKTVRRIKKLVLTGDEWWGKENDVVFFNNANIQIPAVSYANAYCSHYRLGSSYTNIIVTEAAFGVSKRPAVFIHDTRFSTPADFKSYLAAQYAAGTPVTVWYVLETPETGIINEPLAKIGDYADEVFSTAEGAPQLILQTGSPNTIDFDMPLKPSAMDISYYEKMRKDVKHIYTKTGKEIKLGLDAGENIVYKSPSY